MCGTVVVAPGVYKYLFEKIHTVGRCINQFLWQAVCLCFLSCLSLHILSVNHRPAGCCTSFRARICFCCVMWSLCCTIYKAAPMTTRWTPSICLSVLLPACFGLRPRALLRWRERPRKRYETIAHYHISVFWLVMSLKCFLVDIFNKTKQDLVKSTYLSV